MERFKGAIKKTFFTGLVVVVPMVITALALYWLFRFVDSFLSPVFQEFLGRNIPGLGFLATVVIIFLVGLLATNVLGSRLLKYIEMILMHLPLVKTIYPTIKQLVEVFSPNSQYSFQKVVLVEYPSRNLFSLGFMTNEVFLNQAGGGGRLFSVYIPTNNLYLGQVVLFPPEAVTVTGFTVEEGLKIILSGGAAFPPGVSSRSLAKKDGASG